MKEQRFEEQWNTDGIHLLRVVAAWCIAIFPHYDYFVSRENQAFPGYSPLTAWFWDYSMYFVDLFFVISGLVMFLGYGEKIASHRVEFLPYLKKRLKKLYPMHVVLLVISAILMGLYRFQTGVELSPVDAEPVFTNDALGFMLNLFFLQGFSLVPPGFNRPTWYLTQIMVMYLLFYGIQWILGPRKGEALGYVLGLGLGILLTVTAYPTVIFHCRALVGFFAGCLLGKVYEWEKRSLPRQMFYKNLLGIISLIFPLGFFLCLKNLGQGSFGPITWLTAYYVILVWCPLVYFVLHCNLCSILGGWKVVKVLSALSFPLYMVHFVVIMVFCLLAQWGALPMPLGSKYFFLLYVASLVVVTGAIGIGTKIIGLKQKTNRK